MLPARRVLAGICIGFVALVLALALPPAAERGFAAPERSASRTQVDQRWPIAGEGGSTELSGLAPRATFDVVIPPGWAPSAPGALTLEYELPNLVESAAIGVELNGEFVDAVALSPHSGTVAVELPADGFRTGSNAVRVEATIEVVDDRECPDPWHPARVVTFAETSRVEVPLVPVGPLLLDQLPAALEPVGVDRRTVTVRLAAAPSDEELTAAAAVIAALRDEAVLGVDIDVASLDSGARATGPDILIGVAADLAAAGYDVPTAPGGILQIGRNWSSNTRLVVSGSTPADVLAAGRVVGSAPASPVMVGIEPGAAPRPPVPRERFTLADLGNLDRELTGPGVESTVYGFDAAISVAPTSMTVTVDAVRSASAEKVSGLSVYVNNSRVGTVHFDIDTGTTSGVQLNVSGDDVRPGQNFLRIDAEFQGPAFDCEQRPPDESVEISSSTSIELITNEDSVPIDLEDLPYLLRAPRDSADLVVVLPENPTEQDYSDAIDIAVTYGDEGFPAQVTHAGALDATNLAGRHVIALGEPEAQPLHELIPDSIVATHDDLVETGSPAIDGTSRLDGVIEVVPNPFDATRAIMLATGFDAGGADLAQRVLLEPQLRGELYGRATFIGGTATNPLLAPVLEPVRIVRGELAADVEVPRDDATTTSLAAADVVASTIDDGAGFGDPSSETQVELNPVPLGFAGILGIGMLSAGGGVLLVQRHRRRVSATGTVTT